MSEPIDLDLSPDPDVVSYHHHYDPVLNPGYTVITDPNGNTQSFSYDPVLIEPRTCITEALPSPDLSGDVYNFRYDAWGRLLERETPEGVTTYTYDELPPEEEEDASSAGWSTHFDADSRTVTWVAPDGTVTIHQLDEADLEAELEEEGSDASCPLPL